MTIFRRFEARTPDAAKLLAAFSLACALVACSSDNPTPAAGDSGAASVECVAGSDCHAVANTCNSCSCVSRPTGQSDPACTGTIVACLVDPCLEKTASCAGGRCVIAD